MSLEQAAREALYAIEMLLKIDDVEFDEEHVLDSPYGAALQARKSLIEVLAQRSGQHSDDFAVDRMAAAMKKKLAEKREQGYGGWEHCEASNLRNKLYNHMEKGDPLDVANFCMMLWNRGDSVARSQQERPKDFLVELPSLTGGIVHHEKLGELFDTLQVHKYAVNYALLCKDAMGNQEKPEPVGEVETLDVDGDGRLCVWFRADQRIYIGDKLYTQPPRRD